MIFVKFDLYDWKAYIQRCLKHCRLSAKTPILTVVSCTLTQTTTTATNAKSLLLWWKCKQSVELVNNNANKILRVMTWPKTYNLYAANAHRCGNNVAVHKHVSDFAKVKKHVWNNPVIHTINIMMLNIHKLCLFQRIQISYMNVLLYLNHEIWNVLQYTYLVLAMRRNKWITSVIVATTYKFRDSHGQTSQEELPNRIN